MHLRQDSDCYRRTPPCFKPIPIARAAGHSPRIKAITACSSQKNKRKASKVAGKHLTGWSCFNGNNAKPGRTKMPCVRPTLAKEHTRREAERMSAVWMDLEIAADCRKFPEFYAQALFALG